MTLASCGWSTWNPDLPAELVHLETGLRLTPVLYSNRANRASQLAAGPGLIYGERSLDGRQITFQTELAGTRLRWIYDLNESVLSVDWATLAHGEWGLRFWVTLCVHGPPGCRFDYDRARGLLSGRAASGRQVLIRAAKDPLLVTFHHDLDALTDEFETHGYFYLASRGLSGHCAALRFNLEEAPAMRLSVTSDGPARPPLPDALAPSATPPHPQQQLQAIHDVVAWNHVFDAINQRPYTVLTRNWNSQKFGGFGVWMNDVLYHALLWSLFDPTKARHNLNAVFAAQTAAGNLPCLITGNDAWLDRSQPPIASFIVWAVAARARDHDLLAWAFPRLLRNHDWWWQRRALADTGLVAYGTSLDAGDGLYKGTKLAAKDESSMDNSPVHDPAPFNPQTGLLEACDVGLNSLLALDSEILTTIALALGHDQDARRLTQRAERHKARIREHLWDDERRVFANRLLDGTFVDALAPTSFYPLVAGAASAEQTDALIDGYLNPEDKFGGSIGLPSVARDHPAYSDNVYWRGRVWAPLNFWVYYGLRRGQRYDEAAALAASSGRLFQHGWRRRLCGENYSADSGEIRDQTDTDPFYTWGALLPALAVAQTIDLTPWQGLSLNPSTVEHAFGPLQTPIGSLSIINHKTHWQVIRDGTSWLRGTLAGEFTKLCFSADTPSEFYACLPATRAPCWLALDQTMIKNATIDGQKLPFNGDTITIPRGQNGRQLCVK